MKICASLFVVFSAPAVVVDGLAFSVFRAFDGHPGLKQLAPPTTQEGAKFNIRMDIGQKDNEAHLHLKNFGIELLQEGTVKKDERVGLPGADGPHPQTSTGALPLNVFSTPSFVDMFGTQSVRFEKGAWEVVWKKDQMCGGVIIGLQVPAGATRNSNTASLPAGRLYMSFPVWTEDGLAEKQGLKRETESKCKEYIEEKMDEIRKMEETSNLFMKALHYRNAIAAVEKIDFSGIRTLENSVPDDTDTLPIGNGLMMNTKGTLWRKEVNFFGGSHSLLGEAFLSPVLEDSTEVLRP